MYPVINPTFARASGITTRFSFNDSSEDAKAIRSPSNVPDPVQVKLADIARLSFKLTVPPAESMIRLPVAVLVSMVLSFVTPICILPNVPPDDTIAPPPPGD